MDLTRPKHQGLILPPVAGTPNELIDAANGLQLLDRFEDLIQLVDHDELRVKEGKRRLVVKQHSAYNLQRKR